MKYLATHKNSVVFGKPHDSSDKESEFDRLIFTLTKNGVRIKEQLAYDAYTYTFEGSIPFDVLRKAIRELKIIMGAKPSKKGKKITKR